MGYHCAVVRPCRRAAIVIPVTLSSTILRKLTDVPADAAPTAAPVTAVVTPGVIAVLSIRATGAWRLWAATVGMVAGSAVGALFFGIHDTGRVSGTSGT